MKYAPENVLKFFSLLAIAALVLGFLIWNIYLVRLGFYEFNVIQARYIHAGIAFLFLFTVPIWFFMRFLQYIHAKYSSETLYFMVLYFGVILFILFLYFYTLLVFPMFSQSIGGAQPRVLSIIASESDTEYLAGFGIKKSSPIITQNLCIAYENQEFILILLNDKILSIKKDYLRGFNSLPAKTRDEIAADCSKLARGWALNQAEWTQ